MTTTNITRPYGFVATDTAADALELARRARAEFHRQRRGGAGTTGAIRADEMRRAMALARAYVSHARRRRAQEAARASR